METSKKFVGQRFGFVVVLEVPSCQKGQVLVQCDCGAKVTRNLYTMARNLKAGYTISCGCKRSYGFVKGNSFASGKSGGVQANCKRCGLLFKYYANRKSQEYCGRACYEAARKDVIDKRKSDRLSKVFCCTLCQSDFTGRKRKYCSKQCLVSSLKIKRVYDYKAKKARRKAIADGDGTTIQSLIDEQGRDCWICKKRIDFTLSFPHSMSATIDHVLPISKFGRHCRENCRLAHLSCNSKRGAKVDMNAVDLFCFSAS